MRNILFSIISALWLVQLTSGVLSAQSVSENSFSFENNRLIDTLEEISSHTGYSILYRESLISDINISLSGTAQTIMEQLKAALHPLGFDLLIDENLKQAVLFRIKTVKNFRNPVFKGQIVDAETGERIPFATVTWESNGRKSGIAADETGSFFLAKFPDNKPLSLNVGSLGYESKNIVLNPSEEETLSDVTFRLNLLVSDLSEVVIDGSYSAGTASVAKRTLDPGISNIVGEVNTFKALQTLPAVSQTVAMSDGLHLRGSPVDGLHVMLDNVSLYNQSHMFGLFDNFNNDALKTAEFYYDITPANYAAPLGGTLSLVNKTGSVNQFKFRGGLSNSSFKATAEGPLQKGTSSFLISGRISIIDQVNWFDNSRLIRWGLDIERDRNIKNQESTIQANVVRPGNNDARFGDIHAKFYTEQKNGGRIILSTYFGFDDIEEEASRLFRSFDPLSGEETKFLQVKTRNAWNNAAISGQYQRPIGDIAYSKTTIGFSVFDAEFSKEDFTFTQISTAGFLESFTSPLIIENVLNEFSLKQDVDITLWETVQSFGISYHFFDGEYFEDSILRPATFLEDEAHKIDAYWHSRLALGSVAELDTGLRMHYFSNGEFLKWSPRIKTSFLPLESFRISAGFSRNFQFLNRVSFSNVLSSDVWVMVNQEQPPSEVEQYTAGLVFSPAGSFLIQVEGFLKYFDNLRLHEINTFSTANVLNPTPWFFDNEGKSEGIELSLLHNYKKLSFSHALALSRMEISNPEINNGDAFAAEWDRTWQYSFQAEIEFSKSFQANLGVVYATGAPDKLSQFEANKESRLGDYFRSDLGVTFTKPFGNALLNTGLSIYNLFDRNNPWYREQTFVLDSSQPSERLIAVPADVYDLGFQPSFFVRVSF